MKARHGLTPPNADVPCGPRDEKALLPEPVHHECAVRRSMIIDLLKARKGPSRPLPPVIQPPLFDDLSPKRLRR